MQVEMRCFPSAGFLGHHIPPGALLSSACLKGSSNTDLEILGHTLCPLGEALVLRPWGGRCRTTEGSAVCLRHTGPPGHFCGLMLKHKGRSGQLVKAPRAGRAPGQFPRPRPQWRVWVPVPCLGILSLPVHPPALPHQLPDFQPHPVLGELRSTTILSLPAWPSPQVPAPLFLSDPPVLSPSLQGGWPYPAHVTVRPPPTPRPSWADGSPSSGWHHALLFSVLPCSPLLLPACLLFLLPYSPLCFSFLCPSHRPPTEILAPISDLPGSFVTQSLSFPISRGLWCI